MKIKVAFFLDGYGNRRHYIQFSALKEAGFEPKIITFEKAKKGYFLSKGVEKENTLVLPFLRPKIMKRFSLKCALSLLRLLKEKNIQIVLTHRYKLLRYLWFCKFFYPKLKIIFHVVAAEAIKKWHQRFWFRRFKKYIDKILVNSIALKEELIRKNLALENEIEIFYSGVDITEFGIDLAKERAKERIGIEKENFVFGMIAQFRKDKNQKGLIKAFNELKKKENRVLLILVGDGPTFGECKKLVKDLNLENKVIFTGKVDPLEVPLLLKAFDVFVYSTFREGMPMAVLEAMASGLPIIATDAEGLPDLFETKKSFGFLVPKGDTKKLAEAMEKILNLPEEERIIMGQNAKERIKEAFSSEILKRETIKLFKELSNLTN